MRAIYNSHKKKNTLSRESDIIYNKILREVRQTHTRLEIILASYFWPRRFKSANFNIKHVTRASHTPSKTNKKNVYANVFVHPSDHRPSASVMLASPNWHNVILILLLLIGISGTLKSRRYSRF